MDDRMEDKMEDEMEDKTEEELFYAINRDDPATLERLLSEGVDPNTVFDGCDPLGKPLFWFPLHFCCEKGRVECARVLLNAGAKPDAGDQWCMTPLMYAIRTEWHNMVELMLTSDYAGSIVDLQDTRGRTPLHLAVECSDDVCVRLLCDVKADVNVRDLVGRTPLWTAVNQDGRLSSVKRLIDAGCDVSIPDSRDKRTPLQVAIVYAQEDRLEYVRLLLEAGSVVNHRDEANLNSMLNLLCRSKRSRKGVTSADLSIASMLIRSGYLLDDVPFRSSCHKYGGTAIKMAAEHGASVLVELFLAHGANPDILDDLGVTPILSAAYNNLIPTAIVLLRNNCRTDIIGEVKMDHATRQMSPLQCALAKRYFALVRLLIECGADVCCLDSLNEFNVSDSTGSTEEDCEFWLWYVIRASNPVPLFDLCVRKIRKHLGLQVVSKVAHLTVPPLIQRCIKLEDVLENYIT